MILPNEARGRELLRLLVAACGVRLRLILQIVLFQNVKRDPTHAQLG